MSKRLAPLLFLISATLFLGAASQKDFQPEIRKINPPRLGPEHLGERVLCHRPLRKGGPQLMVEERDGKIVGHSYGHSGSGWTLGPGSTKYVVGLLEEKMASRNMTKDEPVTVIGAGVNGLMSALELKDRGFSHVTVIAESFDNLTSHKAGGQFAPVYMGNDPDKQPLMDQIGVVSYEYYRSIIEGKHKYLKRGGFFCHRLFRESRRFWSRAVCRSWRHGPSKESGLRFSKRDHTYYVRL